MEQDRAGGPVIRAWEHHAMLARRDEVGASLKCGSAAQIADVADIQLKAGYKEDDIRKILDENLRRVAKAVWKPVGRDY